MNKHTLLMIAGLLATCLVFGASIAHAQAAGSLDPTFGTGGTVSTSVGNPDIFPLGAFEQPNGNIVVISTFDEGTTLATSIGLARYTSAGVLDTTFGNSGITTTSLPG